MEDKNRDESLGKAIVGVSWVFLALKFIVIFTLILIVILHFIGAPLWLAPIISVVLLGVYKLILVLVGKFVAWSGKQ